jgi:hypothetical protein
LPMFSGLLPDPVDERLIRTAIRSSARQALR